MKKYKETAWTGQVREMLKTLLERELGCVVQHTGWSCNSCFHSMKLDLRKDIHDYWVSVLAFRGDYKDIEPMTISHWENIRELVVALLKKSITSSKEFKELNNEK
jgi:hypothetical protein